MTSSKPCFRRLDVLAVVSLLVDHSGWSSLGSSLGAAMAEVCRSWKEGLEKWTYLQKPREETAFINANQDV